MRFLIEAIDRQTGKSIAPFVIEATDEKGALEEAGRRAILVERIEVCDETVPVTFAARSRSLTSENTRFLMALTCLILVLLSIPCLSAPFGTFSDRVKRGSQGQAFERFRQGERLSDSDVAALAGTERTISAEEQRRSAWWTLGLGLLVCVVPACAIAVYLFRTRHSA